MKVFFWFQAVYRNGAVGVFSLEFIGLLKSRIGFRREFDVFATCHCVFKRLFNFLEGL